jgi:diaminohydroxyphosphoribosylaminopyrimidine deaminase/5-amino-6-(5-phosphoribosylamino)uracil reductase
VIVDGEGRTPLTARVFNEPGQTLLALGRAAKPKERAAFTRAGAEIVELPAAQGQVDLGKLMEELGKRQITSVLVEGGGILLGSLFDQGLVDKVIAFIAPVIIGGAEAKTAVAGRGVDKVAESFRLERLKAEKLGDDLMVSGYVAVKGGRRCLPGL